MTPEPTTNQAVCYRHPDRPTGLACSQCGRPICGLCAVPGTVGQFCPECAAARGPQRIIDARSTTGSLRRAAPITFFIMAVTIGAYALRLFAPEVDARVFEAFAQANFLVAAGEWWRIFTPILLHAATFHILFNMWALYQLGPGVERRLSPWSYIGLYLACAGVGGAFAYHLGGPGDVLVGASGAIFGLFGIWFHAAFRARETPLGRGLLANLGLTLALNAALPLIYPQISWQGHLGGFFAGVLIGELWSRVPDRKWQPLMPVAVAVAAVLSVVV